MEKLELPSALFCFPPGFRFHPSDQELIVHYLQNKVTSHPLPASVIAEIDLYKYNPWELPKKALFGEDEWYFFSPRDRKYPNGARPNRAAASGYWKATGTDKPILALGGSKRIGVKKSLVFHAGRPPKGIKTGWIMNEYRLPDPAIKPSRLKGSMRLDEWVLCRVRQKSNVAKCTDDRDKQSSDSALYLPEVEIAHPASKYSFSMDTDHLYRHCQVMGSLLAGQSLPAIETISTISFQGDNSSPSAVSSIYNRVDTLKRTPVAGNGSEGHILPEKKRNEEGCGDDDRVCRMVAVCDRNQCSEHQNQENMFDLQPSDSIINFQEFNGWALKQMLTALP